MLKAATEEFAPRWFLRVEDNVYVSPSHALAALPQWRGMAVEYVGCLASHRHVDWRTLDGQKARPGLCPPVSRRACAVMGHGPLILRQHAGCMCIWRQYHVILTGVQC